MESTAYNQGSHGIEKPGKSLEFVLVFFPGLEIGNFLENREISCKVGKILQKRFWHNSGTIKDTKMADHFLDSVAQNRNDHVGLVFLELRQTALLKQIG